MLFRLGLLLLACMKVTHASGPELADPPAINFTAGRGVETFIVRYHPLVINDTRTGKVIANFTTRMYCWGSPGCTVPAATFILHPGVPALIKLCNALEGLGAENLTDTYVKDVGYTPYKDMDVINLHTHGLNVNPSEDNVVTRWVNPFCPPGMDSTSGWGCQVANASRTNYKCQMYNFTIPDYHYPGSHWWHTHQHGSVTFQVAGGLFGAIEVAPPAAYPPAMQSSWFMINYLFLANNGSCVCPTQSCDAADNPAMPVPPRCRYHPFGFEYSDAVQDRAGFPIPSRCMIWCLYTPQQRNASGGDMTTELSSTQLKAYLVNGQYQPTKTLNVGEWHRFRIVMTTLHFLFLKLPPAADCESYLLGQDGIDFANSSDFVDGRGPRNINAKPYFGSIVMPIGGRADIAIRCKNNGTYDLMALKAAIANRTTPIFDVSPNFSAENKQALQELSASSSDCLGGSPNTTMPFGMPTTDIDLKLADIRVVGPSNPTLAPSMPPQNHVPYKDCPYLKDTRREAVQTGFSVDVTATPAAHADTAMMTPNIVFPARPFQNPRHMPQFTNLGLPRMGTGMNNVSYSEHDPLFGFQTNQVHEWTVFIRYHPFHHHTWPYQVQFEFPYWLERQDGNTTLIDSSGWFVQGGDWRDVVGLYGSLIVRVNYVANGSLAHDILNNKLVIHCHYVFHEDYGMMQWFQMNETTTPPLTFNPGNTEFSIDNAQNTVTRYINSVCANATSASRSTTRFVTGKSVVNSTVLGTSFGLELGQITTEFVNKSFYAIFSGTSRENVHNFFVGYGVSVSSTPKCGNDVGIALRLQVFRNSTSQTDHLYQAIPVDINPPHIVVPAACRPFLPISCELVTETTSQNGAVFSYRVVCTFNLTDIPANSQSICGTVGAFRNIFDSVTTTASQRGFTWYYGEGIGSSKFPMYTNANVQSCPIEFVEVPPDSVIGGTPATETTCNYGYFNLENTASSTYNFSICNQFSFFPTSAPTPRASAGYRVRVTDTIGVAIGLVSLAGAVGW